MNRSVRRRRAQWAVPLLLVAAACTSSGGASASATARSAAPSAALATMTPAPTAPPDAVPDELAGRWKTTSGDRFVLTLRRNSYTIDRAGGGSGTGHVSVNGDRIEFSQGSLGCVDTGTWTWQVNDQQLTLIPTATRDPCSGRLDAFENRVYVR